MKETFLLILVAFGSRLLRLLFGHKRDQEILMLRKELQILKRKTKKPVLTRFMVIDDLPKFLVSDRNGIFGDWLGSFLSTCYGIRLYRTPPRSPNCNAFIERWNRTLREEVLDHRIVFGRRDLQKLIAEYVDYYHHHRPHQSLNQDSPLRNTWRP